MPRMLDVSATVRAEIGDEEVDRLIVGLNTPGTYACTSCRTSGDAEQERTSAVLFVGDETAVLAFAHATCVPSQVVPVSEEQLQGAVRSITDENSGVPAQAPPVTAPPAGQAESRPAVIGVTSGLILIGDTVHPALVVEPTGPIVRPGTDSPYDEFLPLLVEQGFVPVPEIGPLPEPLAGWSVLLAMGQLHAILQPGPVGQQTAWWQAHQPLAVTEGWLAAASKDAQVVLYAAPAKSIGQQPREDLLRHALDRAATRGELVAAVLPLAGT